jgi:hypothetical protein
MDRRRSSLKKSTRRRRIVKIIRPSKEEKTADLIVKGGQQTAKILLPSRSFNEAAPGDRSQQLTHLLESALFSLTARASPVVGLLLDALAVLLFLV